MWVLFIVLCVLAAVFFIWLAVWMVRNGRENEERQEVVRQGFERVFVEIEHRYHWQVKPAMDSQLKAVFPYAAHRDARAIFAGEWRGRAFGVFSYKEVSRSTSSNPSAAFGDGDRTTYSIPYWAVVVAARVRFPEMKLRKTVPPLLDGIPFLKRLRNAPPQAQPPTFDQQFFLSARDNSTALRVFTPAMRAFVLADARFSDWGIGLWDSNIYTEKNGTFAPEDMDEVIPKLDMLCDFLERLPQATWGAP